MKGNILISILAVGLVSASAPAQQHILRDSISSRLHGLGEPALLSTPTTDSPWGRAYVIYGLDRLLRDEHAGMPKTNGTITAGAEGIGRYAHTTAWGEAFYERSRERGLTGDMISDTDLFYPFILSDTRDHTYESEHYGARFEVAQRLSSRWSVGLCGRFVGALRYTRQDPRATITVSDKTVGLGGAFTSNRHGIWSLHVGYDDYVQDIGYSVLKPSSSERVYIMRPFGEFNHRYSLLKDNDAYRYYRDGLHVQVAWIYLPRQAWIDLSFSSHLSKLSTTQVGMYLSKRRDYDLRVQAETTLVDFSPCERLWCRGTLYYTRQEGTENIYEMVRIDEHSSLLRPKLLTSDPSFTTTLFGYTLAPTYRAMRGPWQFDAAIVASYDYYHSQSLLSESYATLYATHLGPDLGIRYSHPHKKWISATRLGCQEVLAVMDDTFLSDGATMSIETDRHPFRLPKSLVWWAEQSFTLPLSSHYFVRSSVALHHTVRYRSIFTANMAFYF